MGGPLPSSLRLRIVFPKDHVGVIEIPLRASIVIGRRTHGAHFDDPSVSRQHVRIKSRGLGLEVADEGSRNGSWLDGKRLEQPAFAPPESVLRIGDVIAVIEAIEEDDPTVDKSVIAGDSPRMATV